MDEILLVKQGASLTVRPVDGRPIPRDLANLIGSQLTYLHRERQQQATYGPCGARQEYNFYEVPLYSVEHGELLTGYGFMYRIWRLLESVGSRVYFQDASPPPKRPRAYEPDWDYLFQHNFEFRPRQLECLQAMVANPCGLIKAPPGVGKTFLMKAFCLLMRHANVHLLSSVTESVRDIHREVSEVVPNVGMIGAGQYRPGERVTVLTAQSIHHSDGDCDILLGDEGHQLAAPRVSELLPRIYYSSRNYTLTATPEGRGDGADAKLEFMFGPPIFWMTYPEAVHLNLIAPIMVRWLNLDLPYNPAEKKKNAIARMRWGVWRHDARNKAIADDAALNYPAEHQILFMVDRVEHAVHLWQHMPEATLVYGNQDQKDINTYIYNGLLPHGYRALSPQDREQCKIRFRSGELRRAIATSVWNTAVDFPQLSTIYRAEVAVSSIISEQLPGRAGRIFAGKSYGELVDCCDRWDGYFENRSRTRHRDYAEIGYEQHGWPFTARRRQAAV